MGNSVLTRSVNTPPLASLLSPAIPVNQNHLFPHGWRFVVEIHWAPEATTKQFQQYFPNRTDSLCVISSLLYHLLINQTIEDVSCVSPFECRFHLYSAFWGTEDSFGSSMIFPLHFIPSHSESHQARPIIDSPPIEKCMHGAVSAENTCRGLRSGSHQPSMKRRICVKRKWKNNRMICDTH